MVFTNRIEAGRRLAEALEHHRQQSAVVLAASNSGAVVAAEVARSLQAPLDLILVEKIVHPAKPDLVLGATGETGPVIWNSASIGPYRATWLKQQANRAMARLSHRRAAFRGDQLAPSLAGRTAIVIDDGIASGLTMAAAVCALESQGFSEIAAAVPVAPDSVPALLGIVGELTVLHVPADFAGISAYYQEYEPISDEEVRHLLGAYRVTTAEPLDLTAVNGLLATIHHYPVSGRELAHQSHRLRLPASAASFFESLPGDRQFTTKTEVMECSELVETLKETAAAEPPGPLYGSGI